jgi:hypothetical protein
LNIIFQKEPLEANFHAVAKVWVAHVEIGQYPYRIDLIRNEKPIFVVFDIDEAEILLPDIVVYARK